MLASIGQYIGGKVVTAVLTAAVIGAAIWFWRHPEQLAVIWKTLQLVLGWMGFVLILPWAGFFTVPWVLSKDSNAAAALLLLGYLLVDVLVAGWLIGGWRGLGALTWVVLLLGFLSAAVYNLKVCEYQAERVEGG